MNIRLTTQGWGEVERNNILAVLASVHSVFAPCFGEAMNQNKLLVLHSEDHPVTYSEHNVICLSAHDRYWCMYAYQFAHEYCHFQIGGHVPQQMRWFEESLCEMASYFFLPRITMLWRTNPPYSNWATYAESFSHYVLNDQRKATPFTLDFSNTPETVSYLKQNEYDRGKNAYVAISLMPIFQKQPKLWSAICLINGIPDGLSFMESLRLWRERVPEEYRMHIQQIAEVFSVKI